MQSIQERIDNASLSMLFKIVQGEAPGYLTGILNEIDIPRHYVLRNSNDIRVPFCRLESYKKSFFPRAISLWNDLPQHVRNASSLNTFKLSLKKESDDFLLLYYYGDRWPAVHHARMRIGCSKLNYDLYHNLHVVESPTCRCGNGDETAEHYFLHCPLWTEFRPDLLRTVANIVPLTVQNLIFGNRGVDMESNKVLFGAVHTYITETGRFK